MVKLKIVNFNVVSPQIVLALVLHVSNTSESAFKGHLFDLILVEWFIDRRSAISTPPFVWSYIICMYRFFCWSLVTLTLSCRVVRKMTFFLPYFSLSMHDTKSRFSPHGRHKGLTFLLDHWLILTPLVFPFDHASLYPQYLTFSPKPILPKTRKKSTGQVKYCNPGCYCNWKSCWLNTGCTRRYQLHSI